MSIKEDSFEEFFEVCDLKFLWNNINGLEVRPVFSPHPVETNVLFFRTIWENGYTTYAHLADVASHDILKKMVQDDLNLPGISKKLMKQVWENYLSSVHVKKIDIGGGIIHGNASDFKKDKSNKIILAHTAHELTQEEKIIGSGVTFGSVDTMVEGHEDYELEFGGHYLRGYYPNVSDGEIHMMLNCERGSVDAGNILLKDKETPKHVFLILTGVAELISPIEKTSYQLSSGSLVGDLQVLFGLKSNGTYRALSHVEILKIPAILFKEFVSRNNLLKQLKKTYDIIEFLNQTWLFGDSISSPIQSHIAQQMILKKHKKGEKIKTVGLMMVKKGRVKLRSFGKKSNDSFFRVKKGEFWGGEKLLGSEKKSSEAIAISETVIYTIKDIDILKQIPIIRWKLLEQIEKYE